MSKFFEYLPLVSASISLLISIFSLFLSKKKELISALPESKKKDSEISVLIETIDKDLDTSRSIKRIDKDLDDFIFTKSVYKDFNSYFSLKKKRNKLLIKKKRKLDSLHINGRRYKDFDEKFLIDFENISSHASAEELTEIIWELQSYRDKVLKFDNNLNE